MKIPGSEGCYLSVYGEKYYWQDGEEVLFDETYLCHVANETDESLSGHEKAIAIRKRSQKCPLRKCGLFPGVFWKINLSRFSSDLLPNVMF